MFSQNTSSLLLLAGAVLALWLVMRRAASGRQAGWQRARNEEAPRRLAPKSALNAAEEAPADFLRWQVEMHETARELKGELDSKLAALQALVIMARQASERLEAALARAELGDWPPPGEASSPPRDTLGRLAGLAEPAAMIDASALANMTRQLSASSLPAGVSADLFDSDRLALEMQRLADQGLSIDEIARRLLVARGDVELLLSLRSGAGG